MEKFNVLVAIGNHFGKMEFDVESELHREMIKEGLVIENTDGLYFYKEPIGNTPIWFRLSEDKIPFVNDGDKEFVINMIKEEAEKHQ
jgi:hypothetical protein